MHASSKFSKPRQQDGIIGGGTQPCGRLLPTSSYAKKQYKASLITPLPWGGIADEIKGKLRNKIVRHNQCQELGGSCNADLTTLQAS